MRKFRVVAAAVAVVLLAGCSSPYTDHQREGGITPAAAEEALEAIDGVTRAHYETVPWYNHGEGGAFSSSGMDIYLEVTIDDEHSIADPAQFLDYLARTAWSVNDHYPKGAVVLVITGGIAHYYDWDPVLIEVFDLGDLTRIPSYSQTARERDWGDREVPIAIAANSYGEAYGNWPSDEVETPRGLLRNQPPEYPVVPALTNLSFQAFEKSYDEQDCYTLSFLRSAGYDGVYSEPVQAELLSRTGAVLDTREVRASYNYASFCYDEGERPAGATLHVVAEELEWYTGIDETLTAD